MRFRFPFLFVFILLVLLNQKVFAQKIYVLPIMDTEDEIIGTSINQDAGSYFCLFTNNVSEKQLIYYNEYGGEWQGPEIDFSERDIQSRIEQAIQSCPAGPRDAFVCVWCGHGANYRNKHYFQLPFRKYFYRSDVLDLMKRKNARFTALISDTCNIFQKIPPELPLEQPAYESVFVTTTPLFRHLFLEMEGVLDVNSSSPGEEASGDDELGGYFTYALCSVLESQHTTENLTWKEIFEKVGNSLALMETEQTPKIYDLPTHTFALPEENDFEGNDSEKNDSEESSSLTKSPQDYWSDPIYSPQVGDRIIQINDDNIHSHNQYWNTVKQSTYSMSFFVLEASTNRIVQYKTQLLPKTVKVRFGIACTEDGGIGVRIVRLVPQTPCIYCQKYMNGDGTVHYWEKDEFFLVWNDENEQNSTDYSTGPDPGESYFYLEYGDVIIRVNGVRIYSVAELQNAVRNSPEYMDFEILNNETGQEIPMRTHLNEPPQTRFGVYAETVSNGAKVTGIVPGSPSARCWKRK